MAYDRGRFSFVKITLIVLYLLGLIAVIWRIAVVAAALKAVGFLSELKRQQEESLGTLYIYNIQNLFVCLSDPL